MCNLWLQSALLFCFFNNRKKHRQYLLNPFNFPSTSYTYSNDKLPSIQNGLRIGDIYTPSFDINILYFILIQICPNKKACDLLKSDHKPFSNISIFISISILHNKQTFLMITCYRLQTIAYSLSLLKNIFLNIILFQ